MRPAVNMLLLSLLVAAPLFAQDTENGPKFDAAMARRLGADDYGMSSYVFVLLKTGKTRIDDEARRAEIFAGHMANIQRLADEKRLVLAGPFSDEEGIRRGLFLLDVPTLEQARELVETDPAVKAGIFEYELTKWFGSAALRMVNSVHRRLARKKF